MQEREDGPFFVSPKAKSLHAILLFAAAAAELTGLKFELVRFAGLFFPGLLLIVGQDSRDFLHGLFAHGGHLLLILLKISAAATKALHLLVQVIVNGFDLILLVVG